MLSLSIIFSDFSLSLLSLHTQSLPLGLSFCLISLPLGHKPIHIITAPITDPQLRSQAPIHNSDHRSTTPITNPQLRSQASIHSSDHRSTAPITSIDPQQHRFIAPSSDQDPYPRAPTKRDPRAPIVPISTDLSLFCFSVWVCLCVGVFVFLFFFFFSF